jgi:hypothetical protein
MLIIKLFSFESIKEDGAQLKSYPQIVDKKVHFVDSFVDIHKNQKVNFKNVELSTVRICWTCSDWQRAFGKSVLSTC